MERIIITALICLNSVCLFSQQEGSSASYTGKLEIKTDIVYDRYEGMALTFDMIKPVESNGAAVIFINNGGFVSGKIRFLDIDSNLQAHYLQKDELMIFPERFRYPPLAQFSPDELLKKGFTVFDVRPRSDPDFSLDVITSDCKSAVSFIISHAEVFGIDKERIGVFGASSGGYLASFIGTGNPGIRAVGLFYPVGYDLIRLKKDYPDVAAEFKCLGIDTTLLGKLSIKSRLSTSAADFLIIYGKEDFPFVTSDCKDMAEGLRKAGVLCEIISLDSTGHEFRKGKVYNQKYGDYARTTLADFFERTLIKARRN